MHTNLLDYPIEKQALSGDPTSPDRAISPSGEIIARVRNLTGKVTLYRQVESSGDGDRHPSTVGSSDAHISRKGESLDPTNRSPKGFNGMTRKEKELIEDGLVLIWMERKAAPKRRAVFLTLTIPTHYDDGTALGDAGHRKILRNWSEVVKRFNEEWVRECERYGIPGRYVYAIEPQEDRWKDTGIFAPHMHLVGLNGWDDSKKDPRFDQGAKASGYYCITTEDVDNISKRIYSNLLGKPVNCAATTNLKPLGRIGKLYTYLSKLGRIGSYLSKGCNDMQQIRQSSYSSLMPSSWAGSDKETRLTVRGSEDRYVIGYTDLGTAKLAIEKINDDYEALHGHRLFTTPHLVTVPNGKGEMPVALVFQVKNYKFKDDALKYLSKEVDIGLFRGVLPAYLNW